MSRWQTTYPERDSSSLCEGHAEAGADWWVRYMADHGISPQFATNHLDEARECEADMWEAEAYDILREQTVCWEESTRLKEQEGSALGGCSVRE